MRNVIVKVKTERPELKINLDIDRPKVNLNKATLSLYKGDKGDKGDQGNQGIDGKSAYEFAQDGGYTGTEQQFSDALNEMAHIGIKRYSFETTDWEEYLTGAFRLTITQATHGLANAYVDEMEIYNNDDSSWENNLTAVQKRLANDSIVIYSDKAVKCNLTIKGDK